MRIVLVESLEDAASVGEAAALRRRPGWSETAKTFDGRPVWRRGDVDLLSTAQLHIHAEGLDLKMREAGIRPGLVVFLSKHKSQSARPTLTAHPVGNFRQAEFGGQAGRVGPSSGPHLTHMLRCLAKAQRDRAFPADVAFEATHHGPLLETPSLFVELGSSEKEWADPVGHEVLADAVSAFLAEAPPPFPIVVGLGGGHYAPRFTEAALTKQVHFAHMVPTYHAKEVNEPAALVQEIQRASPGAVGVYYHDGTLPKESRDRWLRAFADAGLPEVRSRDWAPSG